MQALRLNTVVLDDDAGAADDLARVALTVDLAETSPGAEDLRVTNLDEVDLVLSAEGLDELDILGLSARLDEDAQVRLALVKGLRTLAETTSETVVNKSVLQNLLHGREARYQDLTGIAREEGEPTDLKSVLNGKLALGSLSGSLNFDGGVDLDFIRSVRHPGHNISHLHAAEYNANAHFWF